MVNMLRRQQVHRGRDTTVIRRLPLAAATVLAAAVVLPTAQAQVIPACGNGYSCLYQWWADRAHTVFNGFLSVDCRGEVATSGTRSGYLVFSQAPCGGN
jgi:hypothetical protein